MIFGWLKRRRRAKVLRQPLPGAAAEVLGSMDFVAAFTPGERSRFEELIKLLLDQVYWEGRSDLEVTDEMRVSIAAQACRLTLHLPEDAYRRVQTIYVFPGTYSAHGGDSGEGRSHRHGEAWLRGPVVFSWDAAQRGVQNEDDGRNVVYHEFAHKLDMLDGYADGVPPIQTSGAHRAWTEVLEVEYKALVQADERGKRTLLDKYGAINPAEFFAVSTELFFERPDRMKDRHAELYRSLAAFYRQDPAETSAQAQPRTVRR